MKKRILIILSFLINILYSYSQDNVFVLVDVSKSVSQQDLLSARQAMIEVFSGSSLTNSKVSHGSLPELANCKSKANDKVFFLKFGEKKTILANSYVPYIISNMPGDIYTYFNSYFATVPTDNQTYLTLAKAKVAEYANNNRIKEYKLYIVSDNINDSYGPNGKPDYTTYERDLVQSAGTTSNPISYASSVKVQVNGSANKDFVLEFIPKVDISKYTPPPGSGIVIPPDSTSQIKITSYSGGTKIKPIKVNGSNLNISWSCSNCPPGAKFTVTVSGMSGNKFRPKIPVVASQSYSLSNVPGGDYRITVGGQNLNASSDMVYVTVDSGGGGGILWVLLLLVAAGVAGWWFWNKKRREKLDEDKVNKQDDIFSQGNSGGSVTGNSSDW